MWSWTLNWNEIDHDLLVGSCPIRPDDLVRIREGTCASALLCLQSDQCFLHFGIDYDGHCRRGGGLDVEMRRVPMRDFDIEHQRTMLPDAVRALRDLLDDGHRVYVHCTAGLGRAPLVVAGYLMLCESMRLEDAVALVKSKRPGAVPGPEALIGCRSDLIDAHYPSIERSAWLIFQERTAAAGAGDAVSDWLEAERRVLRRAVSGARDRQSAPPRHQPPAAETGPRRRQCAKLNELEVIP